MLGRSFSWWYAARVSVVSTLVLGGFIAIWTVVGVSFAIRAWRGAGWPRPVGVAGAALFVVGGVGFFGHGLSAAGGLNWLPDFEWPVGYSGNIVTMPDGLRVVPLTAAGRVQMYDARWRYVRGWHVDAGGGTFKVYVPEPGRIHLITARLQRHYVFDETGRQVSVTAYPAADYSAFPEQGEWSFVPTYWVLWVLCGPGFSWLAMMCGMVMSGLAEESRRR